MAKSKMQFTVRIRDDQEFLLFIWEMRKLVDDMRVAASPFAERLEHALDRATNEPDERPNP